MATHQNLGGLIDAFHEAALEPELWESALARLGDAVGGSGVVVVTAYDSPGGAHLFQSVGYDVEYWDRVQTEHATPETNRYIGLIQSAQAGQVLQPRASMSLDDWLADPIYRKFLRPDGLGDGLMCPLYHKQGDFAAVATFRGRHYDPEHLDFLQAFAPHLRHALTVHLRLSSLAGNAEAGLLALDRLRAGVVLSDAQGRMTWVNSAAKKILDKSDGLSVGQSGFLVATRPEETNRLRRLIQLASNYASRGNRQAEQDNAHASAGGPIRLSRSSATSPLELLVAPLRTSTPHGTGAVQARGSVIIFLSDPDEGANIEVAVLRQMYGLTAAEARLTVQLLRGVDMPSAASSMGISINTARTLLKRSFERTDTNRQSDLVSKILRGPLGNILGSK